MKEVKKKEEIGWIKSKFTCKRRGKFGMLLVIITYYINLYSITYLSAAAAEIGVIIFSLKFTKTS